MKKFFINNGLSIALFFFFITSISGQIIFGLKEYNKELLENNAIPVHLSQYLTSGHFLQATFENWESEFLQMALFVVLTIFLRQKGSSESKDLDKSEEVDREPSPERKDAPWPVRKGGWYLVLYKNSLTIAFAILFVLSWILHFMGSIKSENKELLMKSMPTETVMEYITDSRLWFESFQNWQSEFLSVFTLVILSIFLRQKGSPQSKPVDAPNSQTGE